MKTLSPERQTQLTLLCVTAALACLVFAGIVGTSTLGQQDQVADNAQKIEKTDDTAKVAKDVADDNRKDVKKAERRIVEIRRQNIRTRVVVRETRTVLREKGILGPRGEPGPSPTPAEVITAVVAVCDRGLCRPTVDQLVAALRVICGERACRGTDGKDGRDGTNGRDGTDGRDGVDGRNGVDGAAGATPPAVACPQQPPEAGYQCVPPPPAEPPPA